MKKAAIVLVQAIAIFSVIATALPISSQEIWFVRMFDFPRMQIFSLLLFCLAVYLILNLWHRKRDKLMLTALVSALIIQAINIYPYTSIATEQVLQAETQSTQDTQISVMVANVYMDNTAHIKLIEQIKRWNPDILLTLESDLRWQKALRGIIRNYPYKIEIPLSNTYGMHLYSQLPLRQDTVRYLLDDDIPSIKTLVLLRNNKWVELYGVHPKPPVPTEDANSKKRDAEIVIVGKEVAESDYPVIVVGDFNDVAWSHTTRLFQEVSGLLDPRIGRGFYNTFNANYPFLRWPLDHVFHSNHFKLVQMERLPTINSDHFPVFTRLSYSEHNKRDQHKTLPDEDTKEEAAETIQAGKEEVREN
jgi:endonuclease/exonuclease/phosphatase (EEP) superfamily protein YafD